MKAKRRFSFALAVMLALTCTTTAFATTIPTTFSDVPATHWAYESIENVYKKGLMVGIGEYAAHSEDIIALQRAGVLSGYPDGTYGPEKTLTRAEAAKIIDLFTDIPGLEADTKQPLPEAAPASTPTVNWPTLSGPKVWWTSSYYQEVLDYAATKEGLVTHVETSADEVTLYIGAKWPSMAYTEFEFKSSGLTEYNSCYSTNVGEGWVLFAFANEIDEGDLNEVNRTYRDLIISIVDSSSKYYRNAVNAGVRGELIPSDTKFPWE